MEAKMARWQGTAAFHIGNKSYKAGQKYADTVGNAQAGDVVYAPFGTAAGISPMLTPLDGAATTLKNASRFAGSPIPCTISGVNSIDA
jgi:hypothetical protein